jgi:hypothetical protein
MVFVHLGAFLLSFIFCVSVALPAVETSSETLNFEKCNQKPSCVDLLLAVNSELRLWLFSHNTSLLAPNQRWDDNFRMDLKLFACQALSQKDLQENQGYMIVNVIA